jgi:hypothetical protein
MKAIAMSRIINGKRYSTETATLLADDVYWDGHNWERHGRNVFLYRTPGGAYFALHRTMWQGEHDSIEVLSESEAQALYERLAAVDDEALPFEQAFPGLAVTDA